MKKESTPWPQSKKTVSEDGTIVYSWDGKMHNWEGMAFIPQGDNKKGEYYVYGIKYTKDKWLEAKKEQQGLPWFKSSIGKSSGARY